MKIKQGYELFVGFGGRPGSGYYPRTYLLGKIKRNTQNG
jgi:hypothetical protein